MKVQVKLCGLQNKIDIDIAAMAGAEYVGFVHFEKSPRHLTIEQIKILSYYSKNKVKTVIVCVNPDDDLIAKLSQVDNLDYIQLHGDETVERIKEIRRALNKNYKIIKAFSISTQEDIKDISNYKAITDIFLFDAKPTQTCLRGGSGESFDWSLLNDLNIKNPWFLSGGLNIDNVEQAIAQTDASMIDISSGIESKLGIKDHQKMNYLMQQVKNI